MEESKENMIVIPTSLNEFHIHSETEAEEFLIEQFFQSFHSTGSKIVIHGENGELTMYGIETKLLPKSDLDGKIKKYME